MTLDYLENVENIPAKPATWEQISLASTEALANVIVWGHPEFLKEKTPQWVKERKVLQSNKNNQGCGGISEEKKLESPPPNSQGCPLH